MRGPSQRFEPFARWGMLSPFGVARCSGDWRHWRDSSRLESARILSNVGETRSKRAVARRHAGCGCGALGPCCFDGRFHKVHQCSGTGPVCQLDPGTYPISATLQIGRSSITIKGTNLTSPRDTTLQRAPGFHGQPMRDFPAPPGTATLAGITIRDLTFDGNCSQNTDAYNLYENEVGLRVTMSCPGY